MVSTDYDPIKIFLLVVSILCFSFSFVIMCTLCFRHVQSVTGVEEGGVEVRFRSGLLWLTGSTSQAERIEAILKRLYEQRKKEMLAKLSENTMVIKEEDLERNENYSESDSFDVEESEFRLLLPMKESIDDDKNVDVEKGSTRCKKRSVAGECVICLAPYQVGETVLWSPNRQCVHAFHKDCILTWLSKKGVYECPCCRNEFVVPSQPGTN